MKYIITHCNPANNWLSSTVNVYDMTGDYLYLKTALSLVDVAGLPIMEDFGGIINYFTGLANGEFEIKTIKVTQNSSYNIMGDQYYEYEEPFFDISGEITGSGMVSGYATAVLDVVPTFDIKISDYSLTIQNSERNWFISSTDLPENIESGIVNIWNSL